ncbi:mechanosensitive ion channel family protein [Parashewanella curva]|uniref:Mechanosensitive ion channel family protein n=1 Tax=Parashewanella curva TaxID=2338552 RepID=A0A3L8PT64_9GAMM|nr:mechanosensitive ion channel family protein [Parashewanella curva]
MYYHIIFDYLTQSKVLLSIAYVAIIICLRWLIVFILKRKPTNEDHFPKRLINSANKIATFTITLGIILIWLSELRFLALSVAAFVVALVMATREYIQCLLGAVYIATTRAFSIGDWIKVGDHYGEVVRSDWLSTALLEIEVSNKSYEYTGETLILPNNKFLISSVTNLNFIKRYVAHSFIITREPESVNFVQLKEAILLKANEYCLPFKDVAERYNNLLQHRLGISIFGPEASVRLSTSELGKNQITITIFCPTHEALNIEQKLIDDFMLLWYQIVESTKTKS